MTSLRPYLPPFERLTPTVARFYLAAPQLSNMSNGDRADLARALADDNVLVISHESAADLLVERRLELLDRLQTADSPSERDLAEALDRDLTSVRDDLNLLLGHDIIEFEQESRRPFLKHDRVVVEPLV